MWILLCKRNKSWNASHKCYRQFVFIFNSPRSVMSIVSSRGNKRRQTLVELSYCFPLLPPLLSLCLSCFVFLVHCSLSVCKFAILQCINKPHLHIYTPIPSQTHTHHHQKSPHILTHWHSTAHQRSFIFLPVTPTPSLPLLSRVSSSSKKYINK